MRITTPPDALRYAVWAAALAAWSASAAAQPFTLYSAGTGPTVPNPVDVGWTPNGLAGSVVVQPIINDRGYGVNAWQIDDVAAALNQPHYSACIDAGPTGCVVGPFRNLAVANGWRYSTVGRYDADHNSTANEGNMGIVLWMDGRGYFALFDLVNNNLRATLFNGQGTISLHTLTSDRNGTAAYHEFAMRYNPVSRVVLFEFDGQAVAPTVGQNNLTHDNVMLWGNLGANRGRMNFHNIVFEFLLPGDYNHNGVVDAADYTVWRNSLNQTGAGLAADGDGNGVVNGADYNYWKSRFGNTRPMGTGGAVSSVPEPMGSALIVVTLGGILAARRNRSVDQAMGVFSAWIGRRALAPCCNRPCRL